MNNEKECKNPISCPFCAGVDNDGIPINCLICRTNPKFIDQRKEKLELEREKSVQSMMNFQFNEKIKKEKNENVD